MSFKQTNNPDAPIFDQPPKPVGKGFFIRRLMSLAGKPVLAEKNIPIRPSSDKLAGKCYVNRSAQLYHHQISEGFAQRFRPKIGRFANIPDTFADKCDNSGLSLAMLPERSKLSTFAAKGFSKVSAPMPEIGEPQSARDFFASRSDTRVVYNFMNSITDLAMLGIKTKLRSIKPGDLPGHISQIGRPGKYRPPTDRLPDELSFSEQAVIFSTEFKSGNQMFKHFLPETCSFSPYPGDYGFLGIATAYIARQSKKAFSTDFSATMKRKNDSFDCRPEYARNLVLECHSELYTRPGDSQAINSRRQSIKPSWPATLRELANCYINLKHVADHMDNAETRFCAQATINPSRLTCFQAHLQTDKRADYQAGLFNNPLQNIACDAIRSRLKLKLTLRRARYKEPALTPVLMLRRKILPAKMLLPDKICARYSSLKVTDRKAIPQHSCVPATISSQHFALRRSGMRFLSARHARYCRNSLKACLTEGKERQSAGISKKLPFATLTSNNSLRPVFSVNRPSFESYKSIYLRPTPFIMRLSALDFTDIFLPERKRRAVPTEITFSSDMTPQVLRRRNSLKSLRFKLYRIENGLCEMALRAPRRIKLPPQSFTIMVSEACLFMSDSAVCYLTAADRTYIPGYRGRLEKFKTGECAPGQITHQIPLRMQIMGDQATKTISQLHFISPPDWVYTEKKYHGKIRLAPYPFGFPAFSQPQGTFRPLESAVTFTYLLINKIRIDIRDSYFPAREKVFLPPLSLRNPRRFLYPQAIKHGTEKEQYIKPDASLRGAIKTPLKISAFSYDWGLRKSRVLQSLIVFTTLKAHQRKRCDDSFACSTLEKSFQFIRPVSRLPELQIPGVKRLLLNCARFFSPRLRPATHLSSQSKVMRQERKAEHRLKIPDVEVFSGLACHMHVFAPRTYKVEAEFHEQQKCSGSSLAYKQRLRTYMFPWQPNINLAEGFEIYRAHDEPLLDRLTFFDQISLENCVMSFGRIKIGSPLAGCIGSGLARWQNEADFNFNLPAYRSLTYCETSWRADSRLDYERAGFPYSIDTRHFSRPLDVPRLIMRKFRQTRSQITDYREKATVTCAYPYNELAGLKIPARLETSNLHWIILLRSLLQLALKSSEYYCSTAAARINAPKFSDLRANVSTNFCERGNSFDAGDVNEPLSINEFRMTEGWRRRISIRTDENNFCLKQCIPVQMAHSEWSGSKSACSEPDCTLCMSLEQRPQYRRSMQLYIVYMGMNLDDYDLYLGIADKSLRGQPFALSLGAGKYRHPELPEWIDLPQIQEKRASMRI